MLGENIRRIRTERHLTQSALAEKSGVSVQQINQIEWGAKGLSVPTLVRIARALEWEFESGERAVNVPEDMFEHDQEGKPVIPEGRERLYRTFLWEQGKNYGLDTYSPDFRDSSLFNGLNKTLHKIEFLCGLAYGTFSEPTETDKTATEVKQSKQRSFSTVTDVQKALEKALRNLAYCFDAMATLYELAPEGEYDMSFDWDDSIIVDREVEFARLMSMASAGMIRNEYVVAWYFGVSEEEAKKMMPGATPDDEEVPEEEE